MQEYSQVIAPVKMDSARLKPAQDAQAVHAASWLDDDGTDGDGDDLDFASLTAAQAQQWRRRQPVVALWRLPMVQLGAGLLAAVLAALLSRDSAVGWSLLWGALAVAVPSAFFLHRARRPNGSAGLALLNLLLSELLKLALTLALLLLGPWVVPQLSWPATVAGLVVALAAWWPGLLCSGLGRSGQKCDNR